MSATAADVLVDTLVDWGVEVVFGLPGDGVNGVIEAFARPARRSASSRSGTRNRPP